MSAAPPSCSPCRWVSRPRGYFLLREELRRRFGLLGAVLLTSLSSSAASCNTSPADFLRRRVRVLLRGAGAAGAVLRLTRRVAQ